MKSTRYKRKKGGNNTTTSKRENECRILGEQMNYKTNNIWKTCIYQNKKNNIIYYITPKNVIIKRISTVLIPKFVFNIEGGERQYKIKINDQFVSCFIYLNSKWYVITIIANSFISDNMRYYHIKKLLTLDNTGKMQFATQSTDSDDTINVDKKYYSLVSKKSNTHKLLNNFANQKLLESGVKDIAVLDVIDYFIDIDP
jgi:hypothetical protein